MTPDRHVSLALVRFRDGEALVRVHDKRELDNLRRVLKRVNARLTVRWLDTMSVSEACRLAYRELAHLSRYDYHRLRMFGEALDAVAGCNDEETT